MTRASSLLFWSVTTLVVSLTLYHTSYRVDGLAHDLRALNARIESERMDLHVLKAEWVYLSNPSRIEQAARKHLDLAPANAGQIARFDKLASLLPSRRNAGAARAIASLSPRTATYAPKRTAEETERVNTRLSFGSGEETEKSLRLASDDSAYGTLRLGNAP